MIRKLKSKDKINFLIFCQTYNIPDADKLFNFLVKRNLSHCIDDKQNISGLLIVRKIDNNYNLEIYTNTYKTTYSLLKYYLWTCNKTLQVHVSKDFKFIKNFLKSGFRIYSAKNSETIDLIREFKPRLVNQRNTQDGKYHKHN